MELIGKKVYRLDVGDYYSTIENGGKEIMFGFSQDSTSLLVETLEYAQRLKKGDAIVYVYFRCTFGLDPDVVAKISL